MRILFVVGHSKSSPGYYSPILKTSEYIYYSELVTYLSTVGDIYKHPDTRGYTTRIEKLAEHANPKNYDLVVELHFNGYDNKDNGKGVGCETVHFPGSSSIKYGEKLCKATAKEYKVTNRGTKEAGEDARGRLFLELLDAPCLIYEPFFGDESEALKFKDPKKLANLIKEVLCS